MTSPLNPTDLILPAGPVPLESAQGSGHGADQKSPAVGSTKHSPHPFLVPAARRGSPSASTSMSQRMKAVVRLGKTDPATAAAPADGGSPQAVPSAFQDCFGVAREREHVDAAMEKLLATLATRFDAESRNAALVSATAELAQDPEVKHGALQQFARAVSTLAVGTSAQRKGAYDRLALAVLPASESAHDRTREVLGDSWDRRKSRNQIVVRLLAGKAPEPQAAWIDGLPDSWKAIAAEAQKSERALPQQLQDPERLKSNRVREALARRLREQLSTNADQGELGAVRSAVIEHRLCAMIEQLGGEDGNPAVLAFFKRFLFMCELARSHKLLGERGDISGELKAAFVRQLPRLDNQMDQHEALNLLGSAMSGAERAAVFEALLSAMPRLSSSRMRLHDVQGHAAQCMRTMPLASGTPRRIAALVSEAMNLREAVSDERRSAALSSGPLNRRRMKASIPFEVGMGAALTLGVFPLARTLIGKHSVKQTVDKRVFQMLGRAMQKPSETTDLALAMNPLCLRVLNETGAGTPSPSDEKRADQVLTMIARGGLPSEYSDAQRGVCLEAAFGADPALWQWAARALMRSPAKLPMADRLYRASLMLALLADGRHGLDGTEQAAAIAFVRAVAQGTAGRIDQDSVAAKRNFIVALQKQQGNDWADWAMTHCRDVARLQILNVFGERAYARPSADDIRRLMTKDYDIALSQQEKADVLARLSASLNRYPELRLQWIPAVAEHSGESAEQAVQAFVGQVLPSLSWREQIALVNQLTANYSAASAEGKKGLRAFVAALSGVRLADGLRALMQSLSDEPVRQAAPAESGEQAESAEQAEPDHRTGAGHQIGSADRVETAKLVGGKLAALDAAQVSEVVAEAVRLLNGGHWGDEVPSALWEGLIGTAPKLDSRTFADMATASLLGAGADTRASIARWEQMMPALSDERRHVIHAIADVAAQADTADAASFERLRSRGTDPQRIDTAGVGALSRALPKLTLEMRSVAEEGMRKMLTDFGTMPLAQRQALIRAGLNSGHTFKGAVMAELAAALGGQDASRRTITLDTAVVPAGDGAPEGGLTLERMIRNHFDTGYGPAGEPALRALASRYAAVYDQAQRARIDRLIEDFIIELPAAGIAHVLETYALTNFSEARHALLRLAEVDRPRGKGLGRVMAALCLSDPEQGAQLLEEHAGTWFPDNRIGNEGLTLAVKGLYLADPALGGTFVKKFGTRIDTAELAVGTTGEAAGAAAVDPREAERTKRLAALSANHWSARLYER